MARMTPEQEAAYALRWGTARSGLPPEAQLAYDRLVAQQARAAAAAPVPRRTPRPPLPPSYAPVGGRYRYLRNPLYVASVVAITGRCGRERRQARAGAMVVTASECTDNC